MIELDKLLKYVQRTNLTMTMEKMIDELSKSLIDAIWENYGDDDNQVVETKCTRIGTCDNYSEGLIRFRLYNV